jgi:hypothetical protein
VNYIYETREFDRSFIKEGKSEKNYLRSVEVNDASGYIKMNAWNDNIADIETMREGDIVKITHCSAKFSNYTERVELHTSDQTRIFKNPDDITEELLSQLRSTEITTFAQIQQLRYPLNIKIKIKVINIGEETTFGKQSNLMLKIKVIDENGVPGSLVAWNDDIEKIVELKLGDIIILQYVKYQYSKQYGHSLTFQSISKFDYITDFKEPINDQSSNKPIEVELGQIDHYKNVRKEMRVKGKIYEIFPAIDRYNLCRVCQLIINEHNNCKIHETTEYMSIATIIRLIDDGEGELLLRIFGSVADEFLHLSESVDFKELRLKEIQEHFRETYSNLAIECTIRILRSDRSIAEAYAEQIKFLDPSTD